jgi:hypothetical protein
MTADCKGEREIGYGIRVIRADCMGCLETFGRFCLLAQVNRDRAEVRQNTEVCPCFELEIHGLEFG